MYSLKSVKAKDDEKIYSLDVNKKGAKQFLAKSLPAMWKLMQKPPLNYCEVIEDRPCHMYFDLDEGNVREIWHELESMLTRVFKTLQDQVGIVKFYYLDASKKYEDGRVKNSAHIICVGEKYILQSPTQGRAFIQRLSDIFDTELNIDTKIYTRNRCFRMLNNSKYGEIRPLKCGKWTMQNWVSTLVQPERNLEAADLGLGTVVSAPLRNNMVPPCIAKVLDHIGASDYRWKNDLEWVWGGHLVKGTCKLAGRMHRRNNRYFIYKAPGVLTIGCHHCKKRYNEAVPDELQEDVRKFLNQVIKL